MKKKKKKIGGKREREREMPTHTCATSEFFPLSFVPSCYPASIPSRLVWRCIGHVYTCRSLSRLLAPCDGIKLIRLSHAVISVPCSHFLCSRFKTVTQECHQKRVWLTLYLFPFAFHSTPQSMCLFCVCVGVRCSYAVLGSRSVNVYKCHAFLFHAISAFDTFFSLFPAEIVGGRCDCRWADLVVLGTSGDDHVSFGRMWHATGPVLRCLLAVT